MMLPRRKKRLPRGRWFIIFFLLAIPLFHLTRKVYQFSNSKYEMYTLKKDILILEAENEVLENRIGDYKKGKFVEARARDDLGMIREDEMIYIILKNDISH